MRSTDCRTACDIQPARLRDTVICEMDHLIAPGQIVYSYKFNPAFATIAVAPRRVSAHSSSQHGGAPLDQRSCSIQGPLDSNRGNNVDRREIAAGRSVNSRIGQLLFDNADVKLTVLSLNSVVTTTSIPCSGHVRDLESEAGKVQFRSSCSSILAAAVVDRT